MAQKDSHCRPGLFCREYTLYRNARLRAQSLRQLLELLENLWNPGPEHEDLAFVLFNEFVRLCFVPIVVVGGAVLGIAEVRTFR